MPQYHIVVKLSKHRLYLFQHNHIVHSYPIGVGKMLTGTPPGNIVIINKEPNPGGPFGVYWLGLSKPHYGIHGTNNPASIGHNVSHGCIRMYNHDVLQLAHLIEVGTPVTIRQ